jgi:hypothetical protein
MPGDVQSIDSAPRRLWTFHGINKDDADQHCCSNGNPDAFHGEEKQMKRRLGRNSRQWFLVVQKNSTSFAANAINRKLKTVEKHI